jgi:error-prone DNA polymerase
MQPAGREVLALWREQGEWWAGENPRKVVRFAQDGVRKTEESSLPLTTLAKQSSGQEENLSEEIVLQRQARRHARDSWGAYSTRNAEPKGFSPEIVAQAARSNKTAGYVPLHVRSGYAFGSSLIHASDIPLLAAIHSLPAVTIADPYSLVGCHEFVRSARKLGVKPLIGTAVELDLACPWIPTAPHVGGELVLIASSKHGYQNLSNLITRCHLDEPRLFPLCRWDRLQQHSSGLLCLTGGDSGPLNQLLSHGDLLAAEAVLQRLIEFFGIGNVFIEIERSFAPWQIKVNRLLLELAERHCVVAVAGGVVTHQSPNDFPAQDILLCSESLCTVDEIVGRKPRRDTSQPQVKHRPERWLNAERYFKSRKEMQELFIDQPHLLANTQLVAERCDDDVLPGRTRLPGLTENDDAALIAIAWKGARDRHRTIGKRLEARLEHELSRILSLGYSSHFLTIWDACEWARTQDILFSGRGSVVDSAIAYCLGLSRIDAFEHHLHFDRFLPSDGSKRPDIDIDFEAHRRDDVRNYLRLKYGSDRVGTVAAVGTFGTRGIIREVGKAMGLSDTQVGQFAKLIHGGVSPERLEQSLESRPELRDGNIPKERFRWIMELAPLLSDIPRNIRSHSSGVVISSEPLSNTVPLMFSGVEDVSIIQWDKRTAKHYFDKFDVLCLRGQDVLSGAQRRIRDTQSAFDVQQIPLDDQDTYRAMRSGELIGIPQSASPAMRQAHIRLKTADLHDASLVQAGIRPGVGGAVKLNELIARRRGKPFSYLHPELERILGGTYGIIVFQEQVDMLLQTFGGYTSGEAETIREAIHEQRRQDFGLSIQDECMAKIRSRGHSPEVAQHVYELVSGFKGYGFAQGHALAFAEISIRSIFCQQNFPADYFAAILDAQPAGYYGPCTLANEARVRGVTMLPVDIDRSMAEFTVEDVMSKQDPKLIFPKAGIRTSLRQIGGISKELVDRIVSDRKDGFQSMFDFVVRARPERDELERLILCGAFDKLHPNRRALLWAVPSAFTFAETTMALSSGLGMPLPEPNLNESVSDFLQHEKAIYERSILGLDIDHHLMSFERERIEAKGAVPGSAIKSMQNGEKAIVVGNPIRLRFPPTVSGKRVVFFDLEDESGLLNVTCFDDVYRRDGHAIVSCPYVTIRGEAQDRDGHIAFLAHRVFPYKPRLNFGGIVEMDSLFATADFLAR